MGIQAQTQDATERPINCSKNRHKWAIRSDNVTLTQPTKSLVKSKSCGQLCPVVRWAISHLPTIELKLGNFEAAFKGQMELYLRWLEKHVMVEGENPPIGLILCSGKNDEHIELLGLDEGSIRVAEYLTKLPEMGVLEEKLRLSIARARRRLAAPQ